MEFSFEMHVSYIDINTKEAVPNNSFSLTSYIKLTKQSSSESQVASPFVRAAPQLTPEHS